MSNSIASRGLRAALVVISGALLIALAACSNTYGPPVAGQPLTWGQRHYVELQKANAAHDSRRSDRSSHQGKGFHGQ
jgi:hypothetical protein